MCIELESRSDYESKIRQFKTEIRQKEKEIAQLLESLQRHEMTKDDLRRTERELKQYRTKSQLSETRNKELSAQVTIEAYHVHILLLKIYILIWDICGDTLSV